MVVHAIQLQWNVDHSLVLSLLSLFSSPMDHIRATITTNARLIQAERARLELISRLSGISLNDSRSTPSKSAHKEVSSSPAPSPFLGGSAISLEREQRDANLFRMLTEGEEGTTDKPARIPVVKAPKTLANLRDAMRIEMCKQGSDEPSFVCLVPGSKPALPQQGQGTPGTPYQSPRFASAGE